jgi:tetratricopeptide (TPR) repeat protein
MRLGFATGLSLAALLAVPAVVQAQTIFDLFRQGNAAQAAGDYATAERIFRQVLQQDRDNASAYYRLGIALSAQGRYGEAEVAYLEALRLEQNPLTLLAYSVPRIHFELGIALAEQGRYGEAEAAYRESIRLDPNSPSAYNNLGAVLGNQGRLEEAEAAFREALRLDPNDATAYDNLGVALAEQGRLEEAEAAFREALLVVPEVVQVQSIDDLLQQGREAYRIGDYATTEGILLQVLREPENTAACTNLESPLYFQCQREAAEAIYREALRFDPNDAFIHLGLGFVLASQGRYEEAEAAYRTALRFNPDNAFAYEKLGLVLDEQERYEEAEVAFRSAIRLSPDFYDPYFSLENMLRGQERHGEADMVLLEAQRRGLDGAFIGQDSLENTQGIYQEPLRIFGPNYIAQQNRGNALANQGRYEEAEAAYREALRLNPTYALTYSNLGYLYQVQGRYEEAIAQYEQALALDPDLVLAQNNRAEAQRLLSLQNNPLPSRQDDLAWLPENEPLLPLLRSVVRVVTPTLTAPKYGTGWVVKREGNRIWILTNRHVVTESALTPGSTRLQEQAGPLATDIEVDFFSEPPAGRTWLRLDAEVVAATGPQDNLDVALLVVENAPEDIQPLALGDSAQLNRQSTLTVIGHPSAVLPWTSDQGLLSNRDVEQLQVSQASFGPGSSGGPILNDQNQVVGIVFEAIDTRALGSSAGFGLAYRIDYIRPLLEDWGML